MIEPRSDETLDKQIQHLTDEAAEIISSKDTLARRQLLLKFMAEAEAIGLGKLVGEGEDRVLVFLTPVTRIADEKMDLSGLPNPVTGGFEPWDMGTFHSTYKEYGFVNQAGFGKLVVAADQEAHLDPNSPAFTVPDRGGGFNNVEATKIWADGNRQAVQHDARLAESALASITRNGSYPPNPPKEFIGNPQEKREAQPYLYGADTAYNRQVWEIGKMLRPNSPYFPVALMTPDVTFDAIQRLGGFRVGVPFVVRVTKPEFVKNILTVNTKQSPATTG